MRRVSPKVLMRSSEIKTGDRASTWQNFKLKLKIDANWKEMSLSYLEVLTNYSVFTPDYFIKIHGLLFKQQFVWKSLISAICIV